MALLDDIHALGRVRYRETRDEIISYYQEQYGDRAWKGTLSDDIAPFTQGKGGGPQGHSSIMRRFQNRGGRSWENVAPSKKHQAEYAAFGRTLPPISISYPEFDVEFKGRIMISRKWYGREFKVHVGVDGISFRGEVFVNPEETSAFLQSGDETWLFLAYFAGDDLAEDWHGEFTILP